MSVGSSTAEDVEIYTVGPLRIALILVIAFALTRLVSRLSKRLVASLRLVSPLVRATPRGADRARTLAGLFSSIFRSIIWIVAFLTVLGELRINLAPFVATATVIGAAVGFGAQSLVKDFLSGVLIVAEDQYGVGDSITIASSSTSGVVESVNLRTTRVRALDGMVWYVPNGDIRAVGNNTETDSSALVDIVVPHGTDLPAAGAAAQDAAREMAARPEWEGVIVGQPMFVGVQATDHDGVTLRVVAQTTPGGHFKAGRELRLAILERLRVDGLAWAASPALPPAGPALPPAGPAPAAAPPPAGPAPASDPAAAPTPRARTRPPRTRKAQPPEA
jgi:small conductance mechanosensitive channel